MFISEKIDWDEELKKKVEAYLEISGIGFSEFLNQIVRDFFSHAQWIPIETQTFLTASKSILLQYEEDFRKVI